ncbi:citron Rho-interacting kinase-like isoform X2 [Haliotis asinina]|uniref:citron Rho-interacting kinase-like isoform X2 n=1 Tax=Haliotis asinina TaxID=109174 RepID=UPI00353219BD
MSNEDPLRDRLKSLYEICANHHDNAEGQEMLPLSQEGLLDGFLTLYDECTHDNLARIKHISGFTKRYEDAVNEAHQLMLKASDFEVKDIIGRGHFGIVQVVKEKKLETVYAMKVLRKNDILSQPDISFYKEERDIMALATSEWITRLHYAFQDNSCLYLVMDFHPGGDLLSLLSRHDDIFEEDMARFYLAEMSVAINDLHQMGYVHRDIKPENILLDQKGHIKLADFGSAAKMSADMLVSSRMPVGTPDYVAPELLTSMNNNRGPRTYSVEVDWWSLGICAYEMMYGKTPFTDDYGSMVTTYSNIMNFKSKLKFLEDSNVSESAKDLMKNLLMEQDQRYTWQDIYSHKYFNTINWSTIGKTSPPFIPTVNSLDDTSNFEEVEKVKPQPSLDEFKIQKDFSGRDLPFVGFTYVRDLKDLCYCSCHSGKVSTTILKESDGKTSCSTALQTAPDSTNLEVTLTVKIAELRSLKERCSELEDSEIRLKSEVEQWKHKFEETANQSSLREGETTMLQKDVDMYINKTKVLTEQLMNESDERQQLEKQAEQMYLQIQEMSQEARNIQDELTMNQLDDLRDIISQLEMENENLMRRLRQKDRQHHSVTNNLNETQKQLTSVQLKLDKERRKSRDDQRRELAMMENRDEVWKQQLEQKQASIDDLNKKIRDLEDLVEAYEQQEQEHAEEIELLHNKMNTSLRENGLIVPHIVRSEEPKKRKVELFVTLQTGRPSVLNNSHLEDKIKDLESLIDHYSGEAKAWRRREDDMRNTIQKLQQQQTENNVLNESKNQKKESLFNHLKLYQQEVQDQKQLIKDLQSTMKSCLAERQVKSGELRLQVQELEKEKQSLEQELEQEQEVAEQHRALLDKQNKELEELSILVSKLQEECEDAEREKKNIKEEYSSRLDTSVQKLTSEKLTLEKKIASLHAQSDSLQRQVDDLADRLKSADRRLTESKTQIQQLCEEKTNLQMRMESLQRRSASQDEDMKAKAELNVQINSLQQEKRTVEAKMEDLSEEKEQIERKLKNLEKDREDLKVKVQKLEEIEREKGQLERKLSRLERVEKDKEEMEQKLEKLRSVSREKQDLETKLVRLERVQKEKDRLEEQLQGVEKEKRELERKIVRIERGEKDREGIREKLEKDKTSLEEKIRRLEKVEEEKHQLQEKVIRLQRLEAEVDELKDKLKNMEKSEKENLEKIEKKEAHLEERVQQLEKVEVENSELQGKVTRLQGQLKEVEQLKDKLKNVEKSHNEKSQRLSRTEDDRVEKESLVRRLNLEKKDLEQKVKKMEMMKYELERTEDEKRDLEVKVIRLGRLENEKKDLENKLRDLEKGKFDVQKAEEERRTLERKVSRLEKMEVEKRDLEEKLKKTQKEKQDLEKSEKEKRELEIKVNCLVHLETEKKELETKVKRSDKLEKEKDSLQKNLKKLESEKQVLEKKMEDLEKEKRELEIKVNCLVRLETEKKELETKVKQSDKLEKENQSLEKNLKKLESEKEVLEKKVNDLEKRVCEKSGSDNRRSLVDRLQTEKSDLQRKVEILEKEKDNLNRDNLRKRTSMHESDLQKAKNDLEDKVKRLEKVTGDLEQELSRSKEQINKMNDQGSRRTSVQDKVVSLMKENADLRVSLEKSKSQAEKADELKTEKLKLESQVNELQLVRNSLKRTKSFAVSKDNQVGDLEQEKRYLEAKVNGLQKQLDQKKVADGKSSDQTSELVSLRQEKVKLEERVKQLSEMTATLQKELETLLEETDGVDDLKDQNEKLKTEIDTLKRKLDAQDQVKNSNQNNNDSLASVRQELNESNLALSEARSLLSAAQRQELELRDQIHLMQRQLDNNAMEQGVKRNAQDEKEAELHLLKSKYEMFNRQNKTLEEKLVKIQKERSLDILELAKVKAQINDKDRQIELEVKKVEKFRGVCKELEEQMKDLEALVAEYEKREAEWNKIRKTYEQVVDEREEELEGTSQRLSAIEQARSANDQRLTSLKQQLKSAKAAHKSEVEALNHKLWEERAKAQKANTKMSDLKEKCEKSEQILSHQKQILDAQDTDKIKLKEEISKILTENQELRGNNLKLRKNLDEAMDKFELIFGEKIDLENFTEAMQGLHFLEKYKFESTIGQQMKLIDYLQELWHDSMSKKKKPGKIFGSMRGKDTPTPVPQWKEFQASLESERKKNCKLQEQLDRLRQENYQLSNDLLKLKGPLREKLILDGTSTLTPKVKAAVAALAQSPSSQPDPGTLMPDVASYVVGTPSTPQPKQQRMHHNIPHRFVTGLNTRATKCAVCLGSVHFVKQAAKCQECHIVCHPRCVASVPASCGLPTEYVSHYTGMMARGNTEQPLYYGEEEEEKDLSSAIRMEGWLKVPRTGKSSWEKRYVTLDGTWLMMHNQQNDGNPIDTLELNPGDAEVSVHSAVTAAELSNTASSDLAYVLRIDQDPITTCWPGRVMYLMALTFTEKQKWVASLEAAVKCATKGEAFRKSRIQMNTVLTFTERKEVNSTLVLSKQLVLLGAEEGLFAMNPQSPVASDKVLIPLTGISNIHQMTLASGLGIIIMIVGTDRRLLMVEKKVIKLRLTQCNGGETAPLPYKHIDGVQGCTVFDVGMWQDSTYLCVGMTDRVLLMKYNPSLGMFCTRKEFDSYEPCSCVCIADSYALVGTEKFYKISLDHPSMIDFVDRQDSSLAFAAFGAANHHSYPLAVVQVSPAGLPHEFLLCFHEFGVFVDGKGRRSRPLDVKWSGLPLTFVYREPFLYITYFNCIQATVVPASKQEVKGRKTIIDLQSPRYLGPAVTSGSVYILACHNNAIELMCLRGLEEHDITDDKENRRVDSLRYSDKMQVRFVSPQKESRRRLSLTSIDSNTTDSSSS